MTLSISLRESQENFLFLNHLKSCENHYTYTDTLLLSVVYHRPKHSTEAEALQCFPLSICTGFLKFSSLMNLFFSLFQTWILQATAGKKKWFKMGKNPVHQTWYFKLENCKNQVQIDRGSVFQSKQPLSKQVPVLHNVPKN